MRGPSSTLKNGVTSTPRDRPVREVDRLGGEHRGDGRARWRRGTGCRAALPIQASTCRTASWCLVLALPAAMTLFTTLTRPAGPAGIAAPPVELRAVRDVLQVVGAGLEQREFALDELVAAEVAVVVGVRGRRSDVVGVDQLHQVGHGLGALGVLGEDEAAVLGLELAAVEPMKL